MANTWNFLGFVGCVVAFLAIVLGFATPYWVTPLDGKQEATQLEKLGLWEICFRGYNDNRDGFGRVYNGCWWIFAREYDAIRKWLLPGWYATTQALMTLSLVLVLVAVVIGSMLLLGCFPQRFKKWATIAAALFGYTIGVLGCICLPVFAINTSTDRTWLKFPDYRMVSWSFYSCVIGCVSSVFSGMAYTVHYMKIRKNFHNSTAYRAQEMRYYPPAVQPTYIPPVTSTYNPPVTRDIDMGDGYYEDDRSEKSDRRYDDYRSEKSSRRHDDYRSEKSDRKYDDYRSEKSDRRYDHRSDRRNYDSDEDDYRSEKSGRRYNDSHSGRSSHRHDNRRDERDGRSDRRHADDRSERSDRRSHRDNRSGSTRSSRQQHARTASNYR